MRSALRVLAGEHLALRAVGRILAMEAALLQAGRAADAELLALIAEYLEAYPNRIHHPKEEEPLFRLMRERDAAQCAPILDRLLSDHDQETAQAQRLARAVEAYRDGGDGGVLAEIAASYARYLDRHIDVEEQQAFPLAETLLSEEDWMVVDAAFAANDDPLVTGDAPEGRFAGLHRRILSLGAPPPGL